MTGVLGREAFQISWRTAILSGLLPGLLCMLLKLSSHLLVVDSWKLLVLETVCIKVTASSCTQVMSHDPGDVFRCFT